ncbi:RNA ligase [Paraglaciecola Antarctic GD virus 1]|nr:RNA ligase [Paraglaciecola Antarctic GD virus 1]
MLIIEYLNKVMKDGGYWNAEEVLEFLTSQYGIKVKYNEEYELYVLNYSQIDSPKLNPMVMECRSLVIEFTGSEFLVVSRAFDRFFNYGEGDAKFTNIQLLEIYEKLDGSLITVFNHKGTWLYRTKAMIMPIITINGLTATWNELIEEALNWKQIEFGSLRPNCSYIFEVTAPDNRVVVRYAERGATLLAIRNNDHGTYLDSVFRQSYASVFGAKLPRQYQLKTFDDAMQAAKDLPKLEEGYVMYLDGAPVVKLKNPAYVAAHHLRGEGLNPTRLMDLIIMNEVDEYLSVFPEDKDMFKPYVKSHSVLMEYAQYLFDISKDIVSQKDFALRVKDTPVSGLLFSMRNNGISLHDAWKNAPIGQKYKLLAAYIK